MRCINCRRYMKRLLSNKLFWEITLLIISTLIGLGFSVLVVLALIKFIWG